jgi:hypothetical protein
VNKILAKTDNTSPAFIIFQKQIKTDDISSAPILNKKDIGPGPRVYTLSLIF